MTEESLAGKYAKRIKAVADSRTQEIEALYREYQTECQNLKTGEGRDDKDNPRKGTFTAPGSCSPGQPKPTQD